VRPTPGRTARGLAARRAPGSPAPRYAEPMAKRKAPAAFKKNTARVAAGKKPKKGLK
jgi:hypothetical protein